jgi:hypothetical protein
MVKLRRGRIPKVPGGRQLETVEQLRCQGQELQGLDPGQIEVLS